MTTSSPKHMNYNLMALRGGSVDDMEFVDNFKLDPKVAYTPEINEAMIQHVYRENLQEGMDQKKANNLRSKARADVRSLMPK